AAAAGCGAAVTSVTLPLGSATVGFWFKDPAAGTPTLTASATGFSNGAQLETITVGTPSRLVFATPAQSINAGACSAVMTVASRDSSGNDSPVAAATTVMLTRSSGSGVF